MPTSGAQTYLIRVLQVVEKELDAEARHGESALVGKLVQQVLSTDDLDGLLERLYCVDGLEKFALGLMWMISIDFGRNNGMQSDRFSYDVENLRSLLLADSKRGTSASGRYVSGNAAAVVRMDEGLYKFGRFVGEIKRRLTIGESFQGFDEDIIYRLMGETAFLKDVARGAEETEVVRFCEALVCFLEYVIEHRLMADIRALQILSYSDLTLQTVMATAGAGDRDSLQRTIELLQQPAKLFA